MHAVFIPYGIKTRVDILTQEMQCQKFKLKLTKEGEEEKFLWIQGHLRLLPGGIYDYVFPREYKDVVLTSLNFDCQKKEGYFYNINKEFSILGMKIKPLDYLRKFLNLIDIPEFKNEIKLIWMMEDLSILPLGIREDGDLTEEKGEYPGWTHERI